jgi:hypothetical protein
MKHSFQSIISAIICVISTFTILIACNSDVKYVEWTKADQFKLPLQVIDFFYNVSDKNTKLFAVLDSSYLVDQNFKQVSKITETHYIIQINHQSLNIRERDFRAPFFIFKGKIYYSKTHILIGKLQTPQDLYVYYADLNTILK